MAQDGRTSWQAHRAAPAEQIRAPKCLSDVIGAIYDCVLDPHRWNRVLELVCHEFSFANGMLGIVPLTSGVARLDAAVGVEPEWLERAATMAADVVDLWGGTARIQQYPLDEPIIQSQAVGHAWMRQNRYYREWVLPQGLFDAVAIGIVRDSTMVGNIGFGRHLSAGEIGDFELDGLRLLAPHFRRAITISNLFEMKTIEAASFGSILDSLAHGVVLVDQQLGIVHANHAAQSMLAAGRPLQSDKGTLTLPTTTSQAALARAVDDASRDEVALGPKGIGIPAGRTGQEPFVVHVLPLCRGKLRRGLTPRAAAVLFIAPATASPRMPIDALALLYALTPAETRVFQMIADGETQTEVGRALGIAPSTVKTHILHLFEKTGCKRQAELVRLAARLSSPA